MGLTTSGHLYHLENVYKGTLPDPAAAPGDNSLQPNKDNVLAE